MYCKFVRTKNEDEMITRMEDDSYSLCEINESNKILSSSCKNYTNVELSKCNGGAIDVEDLGRCLELDYKNYPPTTTTTTTTNVEEKSGTKIKNGQGKIRNIYRRSSSQAYIHRPTTSAKYNLRENTLSKINNTCGKFFNLQSFVVDDNYDDDDDDNSCGEKINCTPSELTWKNIKEANSLLIDKKNSIINNDNQGGNSFHLSTNSIKMAAKTDIKNSSSTVNKNSQFINYTNNSNNNNNNNDHDYGNNYSDPGQYCPFNNRSLPQLSLSYQENNQSYYEQNQHVQRLRNNYDQSIINKFSFMDHEMSGNATMCSNYNSTENLINNFNFCTEYQWLRCTIPIPQCPMLLHNNNNNNNNNNQHHQNFKYNNVNNIEFNTIRDNNQSSQQFSYCYGPQDNSCYLTPALYQTYEEDSFSNEKRKEKSRDAARCRRSKETDIFTELSNALPVPLDQPINLDKASIMRLAIAYLKVRTVIDAIPEPLAKPEPTPEMDGLFLKALDGFMLVLSSDGDMIYLSENVSDYLGVSQMDMMGQNVYDYSHPCDHEEIRECLSMKPSANNEEKQICNLFLRLKCTLTSKGRKVNLKSASYKVIHCTGHVVTTPRDLSAPPIQGDEITGVDGSTESSECGTTVESVEKCENVSNTNANTTGACLVVVGCPIPHPSNIEVPLGRHTFLSKHSLNMKFTYADEKLAEYLGWDTNELVGQSVFEFHHALDNLVLDKSFKSLFSKGQCETAAYRFLGKKGGYAWVVTQATLIYCAKQHKPLSVVCVNYILSEIECENEVYSVRQLEARSVDDASSENHQKSQLSSSPVVPVALVTTAAAVAALNNCRNNNNNNNNNDNNNKNNSDINEINADIKNSNQLLTNVNGGAAVPIVSIPVPNIQERQRPLSVTASLFHPHDKTTQKEIFSNKKLIYPQKNYQIFNKPVSITEEIFANNKNTNITTSETKKENQPIIQQKNNNNIGTLQRQPEHLFQSKPILEYSLIEQQQRIRPQAVTRSLFAPAPQAQELLPSRPPPQTATASIFAPRTKDMNKGFLTFSEDQPGLTMLKDEPEDLTHLAPTPGDVCVPLEDTPFLSDMLDEFILENDNYCPLLSPGLPNELRSSDLGDSLKDSSDLEESLRTNSKLGESLADSDPFMYRDSPSPCSGSPNLFSPALSKSPGSIDSLCSPSGSGGGLSEDEMLMLSISDVLADDELALRAPYIPMSDQDEALQLLISDDMVMWGPSQPPDKKAKWSNVVETSESNVSSSLEQLLRTNSGNVKKCKDHGGGLVNPTEALGHGYKKNIKEDTSWILKSERNSQKRVHCGTTSVFDTAENKRIKCDDEEVDEKNSSNNNCCTNIVGNLNVKGVRGGNVNGVSSQQQVGSNSQLLQQLMSSHQSPTNNLVVGDHHTSRSTGGGGGGGQGSGDGSCGSNDSSSSLPLQQSNSVLMNLLVSGCDVRAGYICLTKQNNKPSKSNSSIASQ